MITIELRSECTDCLKTSIELRYFNASDKRCLFFLIKDDLVRKNVNFNFLIHIEE